MDNIYPEPQVAPELDVRTARMNEKEGIVQNLVVTDDDYDALGNDRYIIQTAAATVKMPVVNMGKLMTIKNTSAGDVTVNGFSTTIDGVSSITVPTMEWVNLVFNGTEWNEI